MTDTDYYRRRERQERAQAAQTTDAGIRSIHIEMANRYAALDADATVSASRPTLVRDATDA